MRIPLGIPLVFALAFALFPPARPQMAPTGGAGISMGHIHLNVEDIDAQRRFWVEQFDAKPLVREGMSGVQVPGMLILFNHHAPEHGSEGTTLDHFGFKVRSRDEMLQSLRAAGFAIPRVFKGSEGFPNAYVIGPDGVKVEMQEDTTLTVRAAAQHLHYLLPDYLKLRAWYVETFAMRAGTRGPHDSADIPGINLTFAPSRAPNAVPTKGGIIDHIGLEVKDLAGVCRRLEAAGVKLDVRYTQLPELGLASAFLTDPNGVYIELTEGLGAWNR